MHQALALTHVIGTQTLNSLRSPALWCIFEAVPGTLTQERIGIPQFAFNAPVCFSLEVACHTTLLKQQVGASNGWKQTSESQA